MKRLTISFVFLLGVVCLLLGSNNTWAANVSLKVKIQYDLNIDATYVMDQTQDVLINNSQGVQDYSQLYLQYSTSLEKLEILEAYTVTKEGKRLNVELDKMIDQQSFASANAPMYSDHKTKVIIFPQVEVGSRVFLRYKRIKIKSDLPGVLSIYEYFGKFDEFQYAELDVSAPREMQLRVENNGLMGGETRSSTKGVRTWRWQLPNSKESLYEPGTVDEIDFSPYVNISNLKGYGDLAAAYRLGDESASEVTSAIQEEADAITKGIVEKRAQAEAIYRWVTANIRYVAIYMTVGGWVPHSAEDILNSRYGDCKDHTVVLEALLKAKGIRSSTVLVNASLSYTLPTVVTMRRFNHAITYLPDFNLFVDSTNVFATFGNLSDVLAGKTALIIRAENGVPELRTLPLTDDIHNTDTIRTSAAISESGDMTGENVTSATGIYDISERSAYDSLEKERYEQYGSILLSNYQQVGTAKLVIGDGRNLAMPYEFKTKFDVPEAVILPGPSAFNGKAGIGSTISWIQSRYKIPQRNLPSPCFGGRFEDVSYLSIPATMKITSLPKGAKLKSKYGTYESIYSVGNGIVAIRRTLSLDFPAPTCSSSDYIDTKSLMNGVARDLRAQILYE